jgi:hypothetical protein
MSAEASKRSINRLRALGRMKAGAMNKTEAAYAAHLEAERRAGRISGFLFEGVTLKLAKDCRLTVDFAVMDAAGVLEMHDVKGGAAVFTDDAKVKMKVAAERFPFAFKVAMPRRKRDGGGWDVHEIGEAAPVSPEAQTPRLGPVCEPEAA